MNESTRTILGATALALAGVVSSAMAQAPLTQKAVCVFVGAGALEPIGDRAGHALRVSPYSCFVENGPMEGAVMTGTNIFEWDGGKAVILSGDGVGRKPGSITSFKVTEGATALAMADGKVTGFTGSGKGVVNLASGSAAALKGKTYSYTVRSISPVQFVIETTYD
ncbi:MAG: hypothetical protein M0Z99_18420 [Betaproteobacteria bacterium]|nr:hypothetical protein [Betaproteobacteria bacterium]